MEWPPPRHTCWDGEIVPVRTMRIDLVLKADYAETYITELVAETLGPSTVIDVVYGPPDDNGLVCVVGEARQG